MCMKTIYKTIFFYNLTFVSYIHQHIAFNNCITYANLSKKNLYIICGVTHFCNFVHRWIYIFCPAHMWATNLVWTKEQSMYHTYAIS